jgi:Tol biopolymer transport system component
MKQLLLCVTAVAALSACAEHPLAGPAAELADTPALQAALSDGANGGTDGFYFLPPLIRASPYTGTFDPTLAPEVRLCALPGCAPDLVRLDAGTSPAVTVDVEKEQYGVTVQTKSLGLDPAVHYRVAVWLAGAILGYLDLDVVTDAQASKTPEPGYVGFVAGRPLVVNFRIETTGAPRVPASIIVLPATASLVVGGTEQFTATVLAADALPVACPSSIAWSSSNTAVATVNATGEALAVAAGSATITAACGAVTGSAAVTVMAPAPAGGQIAFQRTDSGNTDLYLINADGTGLERLTTNLGEDSEPGWSPNGNSIAFRSSRNSQAWWSIYILNVETRTVSIALSSDANGMTPAISPDAKYIVYSDQVGSSGRQIWMRNLTAGTNYELTSGTASAWEPDWSPDGGKILFVREDDIWQIERVGGVVTRITNTTASEGRPRWSPDGSKILFSRGSDIYMANPDGTEAVRVITGGWAPSWSPDGMHVAFVRSNNIFVHHFTTNTERQLTFDGSMNREPAWRPAPR